LAGHKDKVNPNCPVPGCRVDKPHTDDPGVRTLISVFAPPEAMTEWVLAAFAELGKSIQQDWEERRVLAWYSRLRQMEELWFRTLYALFIADEKQLHHVLSGEMPNGIAPLYDKVNKAIFEDRGKLTKSHPGLKFGSFKPLDVLHDGAHVSFAAFITANTVAQHPDYLPPNFAAKYHEDLRKRCTYLKYINDMFKAGKDKQDVLEGLKKALAAQSS
jgi:hypothetical protein